MRLRFPVFFVRHGQTDWNKEKRFQGHSDIPLNDVGRGQAMRNGQALRKELGDDPSIRFVASPLVRATETLEIIRTAMKLPPKRYAIDDRLIEIDLGDWNGKTPSEINTENPGIFEEREEDKWAFEVPGGESYAIASARTRDFIMTLDSPTVVVGHGASGRLLRGYLGPWKREKVAHLPARQDVVYKLERGKERTL